MHTRSPFLGLTGNQRSARPAGRAGRGLLVLVMLLGFAAQTLLTATSLPEESPRATILRLTGLDIAPSPMGPMPDRKAEKKTSAPRHRTGADSMIPSAPTVQRAATDHAGPEQAGEKATMPGGIAAMDTPPAHHHPATEDMTAQAGPDHGAPTYGQGKAIRTVHHAMPHRAHHHHGTDCPLCPLLGHVIFMLACLHVLLGGTRLSRRFWQAAPPASAPPEPARQRPPSRAPPRPALNHATA